MAFREALSAGNSVDLRPLMVALDKFGAGVHQLLSLMSKVGHYPSTTRFVPVNFHVHPRVYRGAMSLIGGRAADA